MPTVGRLQDGKLKIVGEFTEKDIPASPTFTRTSTAYKSDGTLVNAGVPRIESGKGTLVEEGTVNLFPTNQQNVLVNGSANPNTYIRTSVVQGATYTLTLQKRIFADDLCTNTRTTLRINYSDGTYTVKQSAYNMSKNGEWFSVELTVTADGNKTITNVYSIPFDYSSSTFMHQECKNVQLEQKPYATTFHASTRTAESLTVPASALSAVEGTIEVDCVMTKPSTLKPNGVHWGLFADSTRLFALCQINGSSELAFFRGNWGGAETVGSTWSVGDILRIRAKWLGTMITLIVTNKTTGITWSGTDSTSVDTPITSVKFSTGYQITMPINAYFSNLRISSIARTDEQLANTGALTVDEYTTYFAPLNSYPLDLNLGHVSIPSTGNISNITLVERPCIPDDVYYYPLTFDGKDITHNFSPSEATNLVYSRDGVWVGTSTQNYYTGYAPSANNGGTVLDVSNTEGEFGFLTANYGAKTHKLTKTGTGNQWHGFEGAYDNWITGASGASFTCSGYYKTADNARAILGGFEAFSTDWATQVGDNVYNYGFGLPIEDDKWNYFASTCKLNQAYTGAIGADLPCWTYSTQAGSLYLHGMMWEKKPFASPFCATTRGAGKLQFNFNSSLGLDWNGDWTICYWKKPVGTVKDTMTGYNFESLGVGGNTVGGGYTFWGRNNVETHNIYTIWGSFNCTTYFNKWHMVSLTKTGGSIVFKFWGIDGVITTKTWSIGTIASNYFVTQNGADFTFGHDSYPCNSYYKDLVVAKRALTDAELFSIYKTQMKSYNSSGILRLRSEISEGDLLL